MTTETTATVRDGSSVRRGQKAAPAGSSRPRSRRLRRTAMQLVPLVVIVAAWQVVAANGWVSKLLLPRPADVLVSLRAGLLDGTWWPHVGTTMQETFLGFAIGVGAGLAVGAVFAFAKPLRTSCYPYIVAFMSFPKIAIAPLLIVAFGYGILPKLVIAALLAFFPVMTAATAGLSEVDRDELNLMRAICAGKWQELRYLRIPSAMSHIFPSLDLALIGALLGAVSAELIGASSGLGYLLAQNQSYGDVAAMYGLLIILALIGFVIHSLIGVLHRVLPASVVPKPDRR